MKGSDCNVHRMPKKVAFTCCISFAHDCGRNRCKIHKWRNDAIARFWSDLKVSWRATPSQQGDPPPCCVIKVSTRTIQNFALPRAMSASDASMWYLCCATPFSQSENKNDDSIVIFLVSGADGYGGYRENIPSWANFANTAGSNHWVWRRNRKLIAFLCLP